MCLILHLPEMVEELVEELVVASSLSPKMEEMMVASLEESLNPVVVAVGQ
jgi:hypothetical protein